MNPLQRWVIPATVAGMAAALAAVVGLLGVSEDAARQLIRLSATSSLLLFSLAWSASALHTFFPGPWRAVRQARRRIGLAFAASHLFHFAAIAWMVEGFHGGDWSQVELLGGGFIYLLILLMAATSNDAAVRILGRRAWSVLHWFGGYAIWVAFTQSYVGNTLAGKPGLHYPLFALLCAGLLLLRIAAWRVRGRAAWSPEQQALNP